MSSTSAAAPPLMRSASAASMKRSMSPSSTADGIGALDPGAQVLHQLIGLQHVGADLVAPADVRLGGGRGLRLLLALLQLRLVKPRFEHRPGGGAVLVLRALVLAGHDDVGRNVGDAHGASRWC